MALRTFVKCCPLLVTGLDHPSLALEGWSVGIVVLAWTLDPDVLLPTDSRRRGGLVSVRLESHRGLESYRLRREAIRYWYRVSANFSVS